MKIKSIFIISILLISSLGLSAQTRELNNVEISEHVNKCLFNNYHPDSIILSKTCRRGCIFIKFRINKEGKISELAFSKDSTAFIISALRQSISSLQKDVALINTLKKSGRTIIQPFIYFYQAGCNFPRFTNESPTLQERLDFYYTHVMISGKMDHIDDAILDMLNFNGNELQALDGILLSPIQVSSGSME
ncbi:hypothetical protein G7092_21895 [Mucilaginibacter sp. HC2]|uniref:hypothetical protein n=1 Tax=Mucilaginibacter inviolabilis TaxID=2714892 RepID=UPI0014094A69|nr:hypothetical protein [Mucilaginibacter inviolabilis]NHA06477.1 hypothetical protein [Mucilaginibacter inviolabilis]